jgi:hypothetical protein
MQRRGDDVGRDRRLPKAGHSRGEDAIAWATRVIDADRVGFICDRELKQLTGKAK